MSATIEHLKNEAVQLNANDRADLANVLLYSLDTDEKLMEDVWRDEIARRIQDIRSGRAKGRPLSEVLIELRKRYP